MNGSIHLLTLSGNLPGASTSAALLRAYEALVPSTFSVSHYQGLDTLPPFRGGIEIDGKEVPPEVADLRDQVAEADALVISAPESPHDRSGAFQNAFNWLISSAAVMGKRVALLSVDCGAALAEEALTETIRAMSVSIIPGASARLELPAQRWDERSIIAQAHLRKAIFRSIDAIAEAVTAAPN